METIAVMIEDDLVIVPLDAWEASLTVAKDRRTAFLLASLHRAPWALGAPASLACSPGGKTHSPKKSGMRE